MATVRLRASPTPAHVRTARLVATALARRAGVVEPVLDEIRVAVGEACSRAVALHERHGLADPVLVELEDEPRFIVRVTDAAPADDGGDPLALATPVPDPVTLVAPRRGEPDSSDAGRITATGESSDRRTTSSVETSPERDSDEAGDKAANDTTESTVSESEAPAGHLSEEASIAAGVGLALLSSLVDDLSVATRTDGAGTTVEMSWPL